MKRLPLLWLCLFPLCAWTESYVGYCRRCIFDFNHDCLVGDGYTSQVSDQAHQPTFPYPFNSATKQRALRGEGTFSRHCSNGADGLASEGDFCLEHATPYTMDVVDICTDTHTALRVQFLQNGCRAKSTVREMFPGLAVCPKRENKPTADLVSHTNSIAPLYAASCDRFSASNLREISENSKDAQWLKTDDAGVTPYHYPIDWVVVEGDRTNTFFTTHRFVGDPFNPDGTCNLDATQPVRVIFDINRFGAGAVSVLLSTSGTVGLNAASTAQNPLTSLGYETFSGVLTTPMAPTDLDLPVQVYRGSEECQWQYFGPLRNPQCPASCNALKARLVDGAENAPMIQLFTEATGAPFDIAKRCPEIVQYDVEFDNNIGLSFPFHWDTGWDPDTATQFQSPRKLWCNTNVVNIGTGKNPNLPDTTSLSIKGYFEKHPEWYGGRTPVGGLEGCCQGVPPRDPNDPNKFYIPCNGAVDSGVCTCSRNTGGILCNETIPETFNVLTATECPSFDICSGRGLCVKHPVRSGVVCRCRPGWFGGGSLNDPPGISVARMVDLYAWLITPQCSLGRETYRIDGQEEIDWLFKYPSLHQCMLWQPYLPGTNHPHEGNVSRLTNNLGLGNTAPVFPYDCGDSSFSGFTTDAEFEGPVYGGWHCNECPKCVWENTARCDNLDRVTASLAPSASHPDAQAFCLCKEGWGGDVCDRPACPNVPASSPLWVNVSEGDRDYSACLADSGRGVCRQTPFYTPGQQPQLSENWPGTEFFIYNWSTGSVGVPVTTASWDPELGAVYTTVVDQRFPIDFQTFKRPEWNFTGACDCAEGFVGPSCELTIPACKRDDQGKACGIGGLCRPYNCTEYHIGLPDVRANTPQAGAFKFARDCLLNYVLGQGPSQYVNSYRDIPGATPFFQCMQLPSPIQCTRTFNTPERGEDCHWVPVYGMVVRPPHACEAAECQCVRADPEHPTGYTPSGYRKDSNGLCTLRACPVNPANGLECNGLMRADNPSRSVCNRALENPICECWRAIRGPGDDTFGQERYFSGNFSACEIPYSAVCQAVDQTELCGGPDVSDGCYIEGCGRDRTTWANCLQGLNLTAAVPSCQCLSTSRGVTGEFCETSVCGGFPSSAPCTLNNAGIIKTGRCDPSTLLCNCFDPTDAVNNPTGGGFVGPYCNVSVSQCQASSGSAVCSGNAAGACVATGPSTFACNCSVGHEGEFCQTVSGCGGTCNLAGGACLEGDICSCYRNFAGTDCEINRCEVTGGVSLGPDLCACPNGTVQYPNPLDPGYTPPPQSQVNPSAEQMNPSAVGSFRGCRVLCESSPFVHASTECGGYVLDGNNKPRTRCRQLVAYDPLDPFATIPNCTCEGTSNRAPNPNVDQAISVDWVSVSGSLGGTTCRPVCAYCYENPFQAGTCEIDVCTGLESHADTESCQYRDAHCSARSCDGGFGHVWDTNMDSCKCLPAWQWDSTGICTPEHNLCALSGGDSPDMLHHMSSTSEPCLCAFPFRTELNSSQTSTFRLCVPDCGPWGGTASPGDTSCTCLSGGLVYGVMCNASLCAPGSEPDVAFNAQGVPVHASNCRCDLPQFGGTFCNVSQCLNGGTPKTHPQRGCTCLFGYSGELCERDTVCGSHGTPSGDQCVCNPGWNGTLCNENNCLTALQKASGIEYHGGGGVVPVACSDTTLALPNCVYPTLNYNCQCGTSLARFDNVTGGCVNLTALDCGEHGSWGVFQNNSHGCLCERFWTGEFCERNVCGEFGVTIRHRVFTTYDPVSGERIDNCECDTADGYYADPPNSTTCLADCGFHHVSYNESWLIPISNPDPYSGGCVCPDPDYVHDNVAPNWLNDSHTELLGTHCRFACVRQNTRQILNNSCTCAPGYEGKFCQTRSRIKSADEVPVYGWVLIALFTSGLIAGLTTYFLGCWPSTFYRHGDMEKLSKLVAFYHPNGKAVPLDKVPPSLRDTDAGRAAMQAPERRGTRGRVWINTESSDSTRLNY